LSEILVEKGFDVFTGKFLVEMFRRGVNLLDKVKVYIIAKIMIVEIRF
jgi:hypothetical protein